MHFIRQAVLATAAVCSFGAVWYGIPNHLTLTASVGRQQGQQAALTLGSQSCSQSAIVTVQVATPAVASFMRALLHHTVLAEGILLTMLQSKACW